ncbi:MAG: nucleoside-triphosphatase [Patescibacteria group bacterium]
MQKNILITGKPKSGKSTLLRTLITPIQNKVGLVADEVLGEEGRIGFDVETHTGAKVPLARVDIETPYRVGRYFVDIKSLDSIIPEVSRFTSDDLLYLDEIGQMQLLSEKFKKLVTTYLDASNTCIATISNVFEDDCIKSVKERDDIILVEISPEDREERAQFISQLLRKIEKAKKYVLEPERFSIQGSVCEMRSEHDTRRLVFAESKWQCDCDFYKKYSTCSHVIAVTEIARK